MKAKTDNKLLQALCGRFDTEAMKAAARAVSAMEAGFDSRFSAEKREKADGMHAWIHGALMGGGKRLRPVLLCLCTGFGEKAEAGLTVRAMQAIELIHAASLVHDDIIDHSPMRHGKPTINAEKGDGYAARCGFAMVSEALRILRDVQNDELAALFADIPMQMCLGELLQIDIECRPELQGTGEYYGRIEKKTAKLIEGSCRAGGYLCGAQPGVLDALAEYGHALGILFQLRDDLLDYQAQPGDGKPVAQDMERGVYSMPLLRALETTGAGTPQGARLREVMQKQRKTPEEICFLLEVVKAAGGIEYTRQAIRRQAERAAAALRRLPEGEHRDILAGLLALFSSDTKELACTAPQKEKKVV